MTKEMQDKIDCIVEKLITSSHFIDEIEPAVQRVKDITTIFDTLKADWTITEDVDEIIINVEPRLSYNRTIFKIDIPHRELKTEVLQDF